MSVLTFLMWLVLGVVVGYPLLVLIAYAVSKAICVGWFSGLKESFPEEDK